jgi:hypothetical protein
LLDCFGPRHLIDLDSATRLAGELVSEAFGLDFTNFKQWPVDIRHYPQLSEEEMRSDVLAQLFRYNRTGPVLKTSKTDFWRICLYDPVILKAAERDELSLHALLCYVLTHEFIHISRFIRFMELFSLDHNQRALEETIVHRQTELILSNKSIVGLDKVLSHYREHHLPVDDDCINSIEEIQ